MQIKFKTKSVNLTKPLYFFIRSLQFKVPLRATLSSLLKEAGSDSCYNISCWEDEERREGSKYVGREDDVNKEAKELNHYEKNKKRGKIDPFELEFEIE